MQIYSLAEVSNEDPTKKLKQTPSPQQAETQHDEIGIKKDLNNTTKYGGNAAQHEPLPQYRLIRRNYVFEKGIKQDPTNEKKYYQDAVAQGDSDALCDLGCLYLVGQSVEQDYNQAIFYFKLATADQKNGNAFYNLGYCYEWGKGVEKNLKQAFNCYKMANKLHSSLGKALLLRFYLLGYGTLKDPNEAMFLIRNL